MSVLEYQTNHDSKEESDHRDGPSCASTATPDGGPWLAGASAESCFSSTGI